MKDADEISFENKQKSPIRRGCEKCGHFDEKLHQYYLSFTQVSRKRKLEEDSVDEKFDGTSKAILQKE